MVENLEKTRDRNASDPIAINCFECAEEHRQIAEWLKELKAYREQGNVVMDEILGIIHSTIYDFMNESCDDEESPLTDKDELLLSVNKATCNNLKMYWDKQGGRSMNEQFEKKINESELREVKLDSGPLLQRKNAAWEIKEDLIRREEALEIIRTSDVWYAYTEKTPHDADTAFNFMKSKIKELPSVRPKAKTGRWIISQNDCFVNCSECGLHGDKGIYKHYRWCPNCGAKMEESEG